MNKPEYEATVSTNELTDHVVFAKNLQELNAIHLPNINLAIYAREVDQGLKDFIKGLDLDKLPPIHGSFNCNEIPGLLQSSLKRTTKDKRGLSLFIEDIKIITEQFSTIARKEFIRFNLYTVGNDMCKYFHSDYNNLRLLCTYRGAGTQWLSNEFKKSGYGGSPENAIDQDEIQQLEALWIGILKGESYFNNKGNGIVHRSPPMGDEKVKRLLLKIDA